MGKCRALEEQLLKREDELRETQRRLVDFEAHFRKAEEMFEERF
jgi:hypothetical protein